MAFLPVVTFLFSAEQVIQLRIPVRAAGHTHHMSELNKDNLILTVNGKEREIIDLIMRKKNLSQFPDFGRNAYGRVLYSIFPV